MNNMTCIVCLDSMKNTRSNVFDYTDDGQKMICSNCANETLAKAPKQRGLTFKAVVDMAKRERGIKT